MSGLNKSALLVKSVLEDRGLETPMIDTMASQKEKIIQVQHLMREILTTLGLDLSDDSLEETPSRTAKMYVSEIFSGLDYRNFPDITLIENKMGSREMILSRNIPVTSTCEHHLVPIDGKVSVAYIPYGKIIGLSKINRIIRFFSQRPQVQERMNQQILVALQILLDSEDVAVTIEAKHYCVKARGVMDTTSDITTYALGGIFQNKPSARLEFMTALQ